MATLAAFADARPRCGIAGPQLLWPDGTWQPSRRRFPTVRGTIVRRTPLRRFFPPLERQREHYLLDERPTEPVEADWMLGAFLLQRRAMLDEIGGWDAGFRHYCEDIDLCYRAAKAGWERWYVPQAVARHAYAAVIDQRSSPGTRCGTCAGWPASSASTPSALRGACERQGRPVRPQGGGLVGRSSTPTRAAYLEHRARSSSRSDPRLEPGDEVLDLACGDGGFGEHLLQRGLPLPRASTPSARDGRRGGADASAAGRGSRSGDLNDYAPPAPVAATTVFRAIYYASDRSAFFRTCRRVHQAQARLRPQPAPVPRSRTSSRDLRAARASTNVSLRPFFVPQTRGAAGPLAARLRAGRAQRAAGRLALRYRFTYLVAA